MSYRGNNQPQSPYGPSQGGYPQQQGYAQYDGGQVPQYRPPKKRRGRVIILGLIALLLVVSPLVVVVNSELRMTTFSSGSKKWSPSAMVKRYQHITAPVRMDIAKRVGGLLWAAPPAKPAGEDEDPDDGAAGVPISA